MIQRVDDADEQRPVVRVDQVEDDLRAVVEGARRIVEDGARIEHAVGQRRGRLRPAGGAVGPEPLDQPRRRARPVRKSAPAAPPGATGPGWRRGAPRCRLRAGRTASGRASRRAVRPRKVSSIHRLQCPSCRCSTRPSISRLTLRASGVQVIGQRQPGLLRHQWRGRAEERRVRDTRLEGQRLEPAGAAGRHRRGRCAGEVLVGAVAAGEVGRGPPGEHAAVGDRLGRERPGDADDRCCARRAPRPLARTPPPSAAARSRGHGSRVARRAAAAASAWRGRTGCGRCRRRARRCRTRRAAARRWCRSRTPPSGAPPRRAPAHRGGAGRPLRRARRSAAATRCGCPARGAPGRARRCPSRMRRGPVPGWGVVQPDKAHSRQSSTRSDRIARRPSGGGANYTGACGCSASTTARVASASR